jgi:hypothetical protein
MDPNTQICEPLSTAVHKAVAALSWRRNNRPAAAKLLSRMLHRGQETGAMGLARIMVLVEDAD